MSEPTLIYGRDFKRSWPHWIDRVACHLGIWALSRLFGADCEIDVRQEFPGENVECLSCDATRLVKTMREILAE